MRLVKLGCTAQIGLGQLERCYSAAKKGWPPKLLSYWALAIADLEAMP